MGHVSGDRYTRKVSDGSQAGKTRPTPSAVLAEALSNTSEQTGETGPGFVDELLARLGEADDASLGEWLVALAGPDADRRAALADVVGLAARWLVPEDEPPAAGAAAVAWQALVAAADRLYGSGAYALGRLPFISDSLLALLVDEARRQRPESPGTSRRTTGGAGDVLAALAVSRQLRATVADALGLAVVPTYEAVYEYDLPGSYVRTHVDARGYEFVFHLLVEQTSPRDGSTESVLVVHRPGDAAPSRLRLRPGEAIVLRGRGTIHSWEALGDDERRTLLAIGFARPG